VSQHYNPRTTNVGDLIFYLDAVNPKSYPGSGSTWYDLTANGNHFTLYNSPRYAKAGVTTSSVATTVYSGPPITSMSFNGSTQYLSATTGTTWLVGGGDFTIEAWIYLTGYSANFSGIYGASIVTNQATGSNIQGWQFNVSGTVNSWTTLGFTVEPGLVTQSGSYSFSLNTWYHVAVVKNGSTTTLFVNGTSIGSGTTISSWTDWSVLNVGRLDYSGYNYYFPGYISNLRIIRGQPHYIGTFTPPTSVLATTESSRTNVQALTTSAYTVFLLNSSTFVDSSFYSIPVTNNGASIVTTPAPSLTTPTSPSSAIVTATDTYFTFNGTNQYARSTNAINFNAYSAVTIEIGYRTTVTNTTQILYETTGTGASTATGGITLLMNTNNTGTVANTYISQWQGYGTRLFGYTVSTSTAFNSVIEQFVNGADAVGRQTYVNNTVTTYFTNTSVVSTATTTTSGLAFANTWTYIASRASTSNFFNGDIAYVRAWGKKISSADISTNQLVLSVRQPNSYLTPAFITNDPTIQAPSLYSFTSFTFTNAAITGRTGPTLANCLSSYNTVTYPWLNNTAYFNVVTQGIQLWTVPATGNYRITAIGAAGGSGYTGYGYGQAGLGARMVSTFSLTSGQKLKILVGQQGTSSTTNSCGQDAGGGGGSFVATEAGAALLVAGGGGGAGSNGQGRELTLINAPDSQSGNKGSGTTGGAGGTSGNGGNIQSGSCVPGGASGAGFTGNGATDGQSTAAQSFANGGVGGTGGVADGGFGGGGGGGTSYAGGGGGGYSGGGSGGLQTCSCNDMGNGGGGACYSSVSYTYTSGIGTGQGSVLIEYLG
jgi:Concanavalin A-like lectin/glucanases superfamily